MVESNLLSTPWQTRACPSCDSMQLGSSPEVFSRVRAEDLPLDQVEEFFVGIRKGQVFFSYWRCLDCGLLYCPKYFNSAQLQAAYARMPDNSMGNSVKTAELNQGRYATWILNKQTIAKTVLELGPDLGILSDKLIQGWSPDRIHFVEPNLEMHAHLASLSGTKISIQSKINEPIQVDRIDACVGVHVFDHLLKPRAVLSELLDKSSYSGSIFFVVHNEKSLLRRILGRKFPPFCLQHPQLFSPKSATLLFRKAGWDVTSTRRTLNSYDFTNLISLIFRLVGIKVKNRDQDKGLMVTLPLGNFIAVAKRSEQKDN